MSTPRKVHMLMTDRGELLLAEVEEVPAEVTRLLGDRILLHTPALVAHERTRSGVLGFMLAPWMPFELLKAPNVVLEASRVVGDMSPTDEIVSFYRVWATSEHDKLKHHIKDVGSQIAAIEKTHAEQSRHAKAGHHRRKDIFVHTYSLPDTILDLFDEDNDWGDPTITN